MAHVISGLSRSGSAISTGRVLFGSRACFIVDKAPSGVRDTCQESTA